MADLFLSKKHTAIFAAAEELLGRLGHKTMDCLKKNNEHWWQFVVPLDAFLAIFIQWMGEIRLVNASFIRITSCLCDTSQGHTQEDLPFLNLYQLVAIRQLGSKNTEAEVLKCRDKYDEALPMSNNVLSVKILDKIAALQATWAHTHPQLETRVSDLPTYVVERAIKCTLAIDEPAGHYNKMQLAALKQKTVQDPKLTKVSGSNRLLHLPKLDGRWSRYAARHQSLQSQNVDNITCERRTNALRNPGGDDLRQSSKTAHTTATITGQHSSITNPRPFAAEKHI